LPLSGIRVLEFGTGYVGPVLAMRLADFGADVVKVESHRGLDFMRGQAPAQYERSPSFFDANRNKRSILIDGSTEQGHALLLDLARRTDVVVENFGAGVLRRLGVDYPALREVNPTLVMISLQGLGGSAPRSLTLGQNLPPLIGLTHLWNHPGAEKPVGSQLFHPDYYAGVHGAVLVMAMLDHRRRTGQGHYMDASQAELAASLLGPFYLEATINGRSPQPHGNQGAAGAPSGLYRCAGDDAWCVIAVRDDAEWAAFCRALGEPAWTREPQFATLAGRVEHRAALDQHVGAWTATHTPREVMETLQAAGVPSGSARQMDQIMDDPQLRARGFFQTLEHAVVDRVEVGGIPARLSATPGAVERPAPLLGEHTHDVLRDWLGLIDDDIAGLEAAKALW
jgi:benzylsuccinate CoA-transferase BbsF subunit